MIAKKGIVCSALACLAVLAFGAQSATEIQIRLKALPHVSNVQIVGRSQTRNVTFDLSFSQPVDHQKPDARHFIQHVFILHTGFDKPVMLGTEGYAARGPEGGELQYMLPNPNLITVEHRYFGRSIPAPCTWEDLTVKNAAADMHEIVMALKTLYTSKWVATGVSKGGQTALFYKCFYPNDVDATVAYVAPINIGQEDPRLTQFLETVGDETTRKRIKDYQIALLKREDEVLNILNADPSKFSMGVHKAYEYGVLELPFAFWQYGSNPEGVPSPDAPASELAAEYKKVGPMYYYSDAGIRQFQAFQYQAFTEIGYYNYDITDFKPYLKANPNPTNMDLCPPGTKEKIVYNPQTLAFVFHYLQYEAQNVAFIYGETDAWSATQMQLLGRTNALKMVVKNAYHNASVTAGTAEQKTLFVKTLSEWLNMKVSLPGGPRK